MTTLASRIADVRAALDGLARQHKVPGAALGVLHGDERIEIPFGVANVNTGVPVTGATLFQIGSNTKVYTATLVMQLVDEGLVDPDELVRTYLPDLQLKDEGPGKDHRPDAADAHERYRRRLLRRLRTR